MHWDRLFEDLEGQLASEWEAERAALDAESERLRIARLELRTRLLALADARATVVVDLAGTGTLTLRLEEIGADWIGAAVTGERGFSLLHLRTIEGVSTDHGSLLASLSEPATPSGLRARMTLGFVLRDLARRRVGVTVHRTDGRALHGTIDRAGTDHLDLAIHDAGAPRRAQEVRAFQIVPFSAIARVRFDSSPV